MRPTTQMAHRLVQPIFAQMTAECPYTLEWFTRSLNFFALPMERSGPHVIHGSLGLPESSTQMATRLLQPF